METAERRPSYACNDALPAPDLSEEMKMWMRTQPNPKTFVDALLSKDWIGWLHACENERMIAVAMEKYEQYLPMLEERERHCISPADEGTILEKATEEEWVDAKELPYARLTGIVNYIMARVKPQLSTISSMLAAHINKYSRRHFKIALRSLVYAHNTRRQGLLYSPHITFYGVNVLYSYADADLGADPSGRSRYGGVIMMNGAAIHWRSKLRLVHLDTCSSELCSAAETTLDGVGINCGLEELTIGPTQPMIHFDDNRSSIVVSYSEGGVKDKSRNYKLSASKLREFVLNGDVMIVYIMTCRQIADILTKILGPQQFCQLTDKITGYWVRWKDGKPPERYRYSDMGPNEGPVEE